MSGSPTDRSVSSPEAAGRVTTIRDVITEAFVAGFKASGEGYNGEYPFDFDERRIRRELWPEIQETQEEIIEPILTKVMLLAARNASEDTQAKPTQEEAPND